MAVQLFFEYYTVSAACIVYITMACLVIYSIFDVWSVILPKGRWNVLVLGVIILLAASIRLFWVQHGHQVFFDEFYHLDAASNIVKHFRFFIHTNDLPNLSNSGTLPPYMPGFQTLLAVVFYIFEASAKNAFLLNVFLSTLTVAVFFSIGKTLQGKDRDGLILAGILCIHPLHLQFSGCANLEPASLLFNSVAVLAILIKSLTTLKTSRCAWHVHMLHNYPTM